MTLTFILRFAVAAVLAMAIASIIASRPAASATLLPSVVVEGDLVTLGHLFEGAGALADRPVFRSPDPGVDGALPAADAIAAARAAGLEVDPTAIRSVRVVRRGVEIDAGALEAFVHDRAAERLGIDPADLRLTFDTPPQGIVADAGAAEPLVVETWSGSPGSGRFRASIGADIGVETRRILLSGTIVVTAPVAVLTRPLDRGEVIQEADVAVERRDRRTIGEGTVTDPLELVGLATRRPLREGDVVRPDHVEPPRVVRRGQLVTMVYESPGLALTARGRALADGAVGDPVSVINEQSRRTVDATVIGPDKVRIAGPALRTAAAPAAQTVE